MTVDILSASLRAASFVALFQAAGIALFLVLFGALLETCKPTVKRIGVLSIVLAIVFLLAQYALEAARMGGELSAATDLSLQAFVLQSPTSTVLAWRLMGLALVLLPLRVNTTTRVPFTFIGVMLVVGSFALVGHTAVHPHRWLLSLLLLSHLLIVTFWFGALMPLYLASSREPAAVAGAVTEAFSGLALRVVPFLFVGGVLLAVFIFKDLAGLRTAYGQLLLVKIAGFSILMGLAALNKWRLTAALKAGDQGAGARFRRSVAAEYGLIVAVLSTTAVMTSFYSPE